MMFDTNEELLKQISLGEDSALELKSIKISGDKVIGPNRNNMADELSAMANTDSGVFVLGIDDSDRSIIGIPEDKLDVVETWLREICNDIIDPPLICRIRKISLTSGDGSDRLVIRVDVPRSLHVHKSPNGFFHKIGSSKRQMPPDVLERYFQQRSQVRLIRFDEQSVSTVPVDILQKELWQHLRTDLSPKEDLEFLVKLKLVTENENGEMCPSVSGILFGSEIPDRYIYNAFIQAVCYRGTERSGAYQLDHKDITGPIDYQIREAVKFVRKNMKVYAIKAPYRIETPQFSMNAIFEAITNAVAHRDYSYQSMKIRLHMFSDRVEIYSPGGLTNTMTIDSLPLRQSSRNELLTSLLARCPIEIDELNTKRHYLMDKRGDGVEIIYNESERLSGRKPTYTVIDNAELLLTIYAAKPPEQDDE